MAKPEEERFLPRSPSGTRGFAKGGAYFPLTLSQQALQDCFVPQGGHSVPHAPWHLFSPRPSSFISEASMSLPVSDAGFLSRTDRIIFLPIFLPILVPSLIPALLFPEQDSSARTGAEKRKKPIRERQAMILVIKFSSWLNFRCKWIDFLEKNFTRQ